MNTRVSARAAEPGLSREWNWHPPFPVAGAPFWDWPVRPLAALKWLFLAYFPVSDRLLYLLFALGLGLLWQPVTDAQSVFSANWMVAILARNYAALMLVAGGLHGWFYMYKGQGLNGKYDPRALYEDSQRLFKFGNQTKDNMFYTLLSGVPVATASEVLFRWMYANGIIEMTTWHSNPVWFIVMFPVVTIWQSGHFYVIHRMLHWRALYRSVHALHHRSVNPGPWSGLSMHPVEHVLYFSTPIVFFVLASHPSHLMFLLFWQLLGAPSGHSGYDAVKIKGVPVLKIGGFFHQLHHRHFECNYGGTEIPCDRWVGSHHDGSEACTRETRERMRAERRSRA